MASSSVVPPVHLIGAATADGARRLELAQGDTGVDGVSTSGLTTASLHSFEACTEIADDGVAAFFREATHVHAGNVDPCTCADSVVVDFPSPTWTPQRWRLAPWCMAPGCVGSFILFLPLEAGTLFAGKTVDSRSARSFSTMATVSLETSKNNTIYLRTVH